MKRKGLTRREFVKSVGLGSAAAAVFGATESVKAQQSQGGATPGAMNKRKLGKTGVEVSELCLGGMFDTINNQLLLKQALAWGVTFWDTAEVYGGGQSEDGFGRFFSRNPEARAQVFLTTKTKPASPADLSTALEKSLKKLHTDHVDLYHMHGPSSVAEIPQATVQWAAEAKKAGKIRFFGFSTHSNMEECLLSASKLDWVDVVMFSYNFRLMHTPKMKEAIAAASKAGLGLVAMKTQGGGPVKTDSEAELKVAGRFIERGFTDKQARLKAVWEEPQIASICSQMPTLTILSANVAAARDKTSLAREELDLLHRFASETRGDYCAGCSRICSEAVGGMVPVSDVMRCLMYYRDYGDHELARQVFASLPVEARARIGIIDYSEADRACPQGLAIADLMKQASRLFA